MPGRICFDSTYEGLKPIDEALGDEVGQCFDSTYEGLKPCSR